MARSTVAQRVQIARETTTGTPVPATKRLQSLAIAVSPEVESEAFRGKGMKYAAGVAANKEWATGDLEGQPTYDEVVVPLSGVFTQATVAALMDGATPTGAYEWTFDPSTSGADTPVTFTLEQGDDTIGQVAAHLLFTDFGLDFSRDEVSVSGTAIARSLETQALTAGATPYAADVVPILPGQVCLYVADTPAGLADEANRITKGLSVAPSIGGRFNPVWYLNCTLPSFGTFVETPEPDFTADLSLEADADGLAWHGLFRSGQTRFLRVEATGPVIHGAGGTATRYKFTWDMAVKVLEPGEQSDEDGLYAISPSLQVVHDAGWGRATRIKVINKVSAL